MTKKNQSKDSKTKATPAAKKVATAPADVQSEEDVKINLLVPFLESKGYKKDCIAFNKAIEVQEGRRHKTIFADAVVYTTAAKKTPLIVCETKPPNEVLGKSAKEQAISYARLLPRIAPIALLTNGSQTQVFHTLSKHRISELPSRQDLNEDFLKFVLTAEEEQALRTEAKHDLFIIDDVQSFKSVLKSCHNEIRNNEGYDPTVAFDEMAKVLFCKMFEEKQNTGTNRFRVSVFDDTLTRLHVNVVKQIYEEAKKDPRYSGLFESDSTLNLHDRTIRKIVSIFENYDLSLTAFDVKGEAFEYFLGETFTGGLGEYFTPRNVVEFMVDAVDPKIGQKIVDPFCGTGGFLIYAFEVVIDKIRLNEFSEEEKEKWKTALSSESLFGTDWKERTSLACKMNMTVHGDGSAGIYKHHGLVDVKGVIEPGKFNICITNPPFGSIENDPKVLKLFPELAAGRKTQERVVLALERALQLVKAGGVVAIVVIDGVLNNDSSDYIRDYVKRNANVQGVVSLPAVTFEGYHARAKTSILFLVKKESADEGQQKDTFMAIVDNSGYAPNGAPIPGNELPDVLLDFQVFLKGERSFSRKNSWVSQVSDRLDAEYYKPHAASAGDEGAVVKLSSGLAARLQKYSEQLTAVESEVAQAFTDLDAVALPISDFIEAISSTTRLEAGTLYKLLGVKWWGGGTFIREEKTGKKIKAKKLNKVSAGWIIYNRLFAFRGSFAIVPAEHDGCCVSGEFPTFKVRDDIGKQERVARYIVHCFLSPQFLANVDRDSTGSTKTSRNRYKSNRFLQMRALFPKRLDSLEFIVRLLDKAMTLRFEQGQVAAELKELTASLSRLLSQPASVTDAPAQGTVEYLPERSNASQAAPAQAAASAEVKPKKGKKGKKSKKVAAKQKKAIVAAKKTKAKAAVKK
jgi:type I restriction enzyme M protein